MPFIWLLKLVAWVVYAAAITVTVAMGAFVAGFSLGIMGVGLFVIQAFFTNLPAIVHFFQTDVPRIGRVIWALGQELIKRASQ